MFIRSNYTDNLILQLLQHHIGLQFMFPNLHQITLLIRSFMDGIPEGGWLANRPFNSLLSGVITFFIFLQLAFHKTPFLHYRSDTPLYYNDLMAYVLYQSPR